MSGSLTLPAGIVRRARGILLSANGENNQSIAGELMVSTASVTMLPIGLGYVEGVTHDNYRHGTTTLFAALDVKSGEVITQCKPRHRHQEFLSFLRHLDASVAAHLKGRGFREA